MGDNKKREHKIEDTIMNIISVLVVLFMIWVFVSFIDTNMHNISDFQYANWNLFQLFH